MPKTAGSDRVLVRSSGAVLSRCGDVGETVTWARLEVSALGIGVGMKLFTVDVEDWFHCNFESITRVDSTGLPRRVALGVERLLDELDRAGAKATFFVLGEVAAEHPDLVPRIAKAGHEIGCHSWNHKLLYEQSREEVGRDLRKARSLLEDQAAQPVRGFRAPSWSVTERNLWALDVVAEVGFDYDSSIFPSHTYLYGIAQAPRVPYRITTGEGNTLVEVPPSTLELAGQRFGAGGGFYLRLLPLFVHQAVMRRSLARGEPFLIYTHPREFDPDSWGFDLPPGLSLKEKTIFRFGLARGAARLRTLLREPEWRPMRELVDRAS